MADYVPLSGGSGEDDERPNPQPTLMIFVDYAGSVLPVVSHSPWNGVQLADFVMPFFLFIAGVSLSLVYKKNSNKLQATHKAILRAVNLFMLGILLQGGYFHGINSLTFGVDLEKIRWLGILQRIAIGYIIAALCEIWVSNIKTKDLHTGVLKKYYLHWIIVLLLSALYLGLLYGLYVPDWQFKLQKTSLNSYADDTYMLKNVKCGVRGDLGPACNSVGMIDRCVLGIEHLYMKPVYKNLKECTASKDGQVLDTPSWCQAPFDPEGILGSLMAAATCIIGLQYGHILVQYEDHKDRLLHWLWFSLSIFALGLLLTFIGIPLNKSLYTTSYMLLTTAAAGFTFSALYLLVDICGHRCMTFVFEWMGKHSLSIFVLVPSNIVVILIQGFYWRNPTNNIVHWIVSIFLKN
ncbi:uncharacterized protein [Typha angustifolia]|uniref:uncharacterized protein isoform X2 n=1 Tax=Typha angustifolia TaxID=59011 RepID=UPI003C2DDBA4